MKECSPSADILSSGPLLKHVLTSPKDNNCMRYNNTLNQRPLSNEYVNVFTNLDTPFGTLESICHP